MSTKPTRWLARRLGRRGAALAILGVLFILVGIDTLVNPPAADMERFLIHTLIPYPIAALLWIVPGSLALLASQRKGPGPDGFGFKALVIPLATRITSFSVAFVAFLLGEGNYYTALVPAAVWLAFLALILLIAGWPEVPTGLLPRKRHRRRRSNP